MIRLALEIPAAYLERWTSRTELDFVLAHRVLEDASYCDFYAKRPVGRELILDNSMHELGKPLSIPEILRAARSVHADWVIPPDKLGDPDFTEGQFWAMKTISRREFKLAPVLCGRTYEERASFIQNISEHVEMFCLPFREPRLDWYLDLAQELSDVTRLHLLGVNTLSELQTFAEIARADPDRPDRWSVDTAKPIKWGLELHDISEEGSLRGAPTKSKELLGLRHISLQQQAFIDQNIVFLRQHLT